jgi:hypothetical protein
LFWRLIFPWAAISFSRWLNTAVDIQHSGLCIDLVNNRYYHKGFLTFIFPLPRWTAFILFPNITRNTVAPTYQRCWRFQKPEITITYLQFRQNACILNIHAIGWYLVFRIYAGFR